MHATIMCNDNGRKLPAVSQIGFDWPVRQLPFYRAHDAFSNAWTDLLVPPFT